MGVVAWVRVWGGWGGCTETKGERVGLAKIHKLFMFVAVRMHRVVLLRSDKLNFHDICIYLLD